MGPGTIQDMDGLGYRDWQGYQIEERADWSTLRAEDAPLSSVGEGTEPAVSSDKGNMPEFGTTGLQLYPSEGSQGEPQGQRWLGELPTQRDEQVYLREPISRGELALEGLRSEESFTATRYGTSYNGQPLGCGLGVYSSGDTSILAISPAREWPCGSHFRVCTSMEPSKLRNVSGSQGSVSEVRCIWVTRVDSCPACGANNLDLSEDGLSLLCGYPCDYISSLEVTKLD